MSHYCIKIKRKGFNYYTDYMERYFENAAVQYGYHLTKRQEQAELSCVTFVSEPSQSGSKWMTFLSPVFYEMTDEQLGKLSRIIGGCFKSESLIDEIDDGVLKFIQEIKLHHEGKGQLTPSVLNELVQQYGTPSPWFFSKEYSAFDEPVFVTEDETFLKVIMNDTFCVSNEKFSIGVLNIGGASKGLTVKISFTSSGEVEVENFTLIIHDAKRDVGFQYIPLEMERMETSDKTVFRAALSDFYFPHGFNEYSAKLSGRKKQNAMESCCIDILFTPQGNEAILKSMEIEVVPNEHPMNKAVYKRR